MRIGGLFRVLFCVLYYSTERVNRIGPFFLLLYQGLWLFFYWIGISNRMSIGMVITAGVGLPIETPNTLPIRALIFTTLWLKCTQIAITIFAKLQ